MIKVAIADDHPMVAQGIQQMLSCCDDLITDGIYANADELMEGLRTKRPDVLLLDIQMPGMKGDEIALQVSKYYADVKIIAVTNFDSLLYIQNMFRNGAHGYLLKTTHQDTLIEAIRTVAAGENFVEPSLRNKTQNALAKNDKSKYHKLSLTLREMEIVRLLVSGLSNQDISEKLFISYNTMRNHRARIFFKLDVTTIGELVKKALEMGFS